jgi:hypothetical protein
VKGQQNAQQGTSENVEGIGFRFEDVEQIAQDANESESTIGAEKDSLAVFVQVEPVERETYQQGEECD